MTSAYAYTPDIWPPLAVALYLAALGLFSWQRRSFPAARWLAAASLAGIVWLLAIALRAAVFTPEAQFTWLKVSTICVLPAMTAVTCFALEYVLPGRWLTRRNLALLWLWPLAAVVLTVVDSGRLVWRATEAGSAESELRLTVLGAMIVAYGIGLVAVNLTAFAWLFIRSRQHRWPVALMMVAQLLSRAFYLLGVVDAWPLSVTPVVAGIALSWSVYAIALFGFRIFDPLPAARRAVFEQAQLGVLVFDTAGRVLSLNRTAENAFGVRTAVARGKTWEQLGGPQPALPCLPVAGAQDTREAASVAVELPDLMLGSGPAAREYALSFSSLRDARGLLLGHVLMLSDVTVQKRTQAQLVEQRQSLAALRERERLARELHDSIGQVLGYAGLQVAIADQFIATGRAPDARDQLGKLAKILEEAHADVRQQILDLRAAPTAHRPFFEAVQHYLDGFTTNYDIQNELSVNGSFGENEIPSHVQAALFRVLQEALSNARKHGHARRVQVAFARADGAMIMSIEDDGCGFDAGPRLGADTGHFGLDIMAERAAELGGAVRFDSAPGGRTLVEVKVPLEEG